MQAMRAEAGIRSGDPVRIAYTFEDLGAAELRELHRLSDGYATFTYEKASRAGHGSAHPGPTGHRAALL